MVIPIIVNTEKVTEENLDEKLKQAILGTVLGHILLILMLLAVGLFFVPEVLDLYRDFGAEPPMLVRNYFLFLYFPAMFASAVVVTVSIFVLNDKARLLKQIKETERGISSGRIFLTNFLVNFIFFAVLIGFTAYVIYSSIYQIPSLL